MRNLISLLFFIALLSQGVYAQNTLQAYIDKAKENSPLIKQNKNNDTINQLEIERLKAIYTKPKVGITANYLFSPIISQDNKTTSFQANPDVANDYYGYDLAYSNGGTYQAMLTVTQPLFNGKRYQTATKQMNVASQINKNTINLSAHDIEKIVTDQYILCIKDKKQLNYTQELTELLSNQKQILEQLVKNGIYKQSDLILLSIEQQNFNNQLIALKTNYQRDVLDLNILCGINDTNIILLDETHLQLIEKIKNSQFLMQYKLDSLTINNQQNMFELKYKPQINLFANTGLNAVYVPTILNRFGLSVGVSFTYNLWDGGQKKINRSKFKLMNQSVSTFKDNFITKNTIRKTKIKAQIQSYSQRIVNIKNQLADYEILLESYKNQLVSGQISVINYITVLKSKVVIQQNLTLLTSQQQALINAYNYWNW